MARDTNRGNTPKVVVIGAGANVSIDMAIALASEAAQMPVVGYTPADIHTVPSDKHILYSPFTNGFTCSSKALDRECHEHRNILGDTSECNKDSMPMRGLNPTEVFRKNKRKRGRSW